MDRKTASVRAILDELDRVAQLPLSRAVTGPAAMYTSAEFFEWERERIFFAEWMCVAHVSQIFPPHGVSERHAEAASPARDVRVAQLLKRDIALRSLPG